MALDAVFGAIFDGFARVITTLDEMVFTWGAFRISMLDAIVTSLFLVLLFRVLTPDGGEED